MSNSNNETLKKNQDGNLSVPIPIKKSTIDNRSLDSSHVADSGFRSFTPNTDKRVRDRRPSYNSIEVSRESHYNLDYPVDRDQTLKEKLDPHSRFYSRSRPRTLDLPQLLPYDTELPRDQAKFLSHIVSHLYIAIKTLDIQGSLSVTAKDLAALRNVAGLSDLDIALETNLFEMNNDNSKDSNNTDDESDTYFAPDDYNDSGSDFDDDDDDDDMEEEEYVMDDVKDGNESAAQHKKSPKSAAVVGVRIWTNELLVWLKMKYDMPITLRLSLARVYYAICLCRGQYINLKIYVRAFELLTKDIPFVKANGLELDWHDLYNELNNHFSSVDSSIDTFEKKDHKQLLRLAERASNFFPSSALPEIYSLLGQKLSVTNTSLVICSMAMLPLSYEKGGIEDPLDIRHYVSSFFYIWEKFHRITDLDSHITSRLGTVAMSALIDLNFHKDKSNVKLGKFGLFNKEQFKLLNSYLLNSLSIMQTKYSSSTSNFFHGFSSAIIYSINGSDGLAEDGIMDNLQAILNAIESYVHPSNTGEWTRPISKFIYSLVYQYHKRYNQEREEFGLLNDVPSLVKLTDDLTDKFVSILLTITKTGLQSKKMGSMDNYLNTLHLLAHLLPQLVLENILLDIYESLEGVISTHRVNVALHCLEELARYFATTKIFRVHMTRLLLLAVPGIDSNDLEKTLLTLHVFASVANFVPFHDLSDGDGDSTLAIQFTQEHMIHLQSKIYDQKDEMDLGDFDVPEDLEKLALISSSTAFKSLIKTFTQRIFTLLENIPDPAKSGKMERALADALPKFLFVIFESVSNDIFETFRDLFFDFVFDNTIHTVADIVAEICGSIIKREPKAFPRYCDLLISRIKDDIEENGSGASRTGVDIVPRDQALFWNLVILNECIGNASEFTLRRAKDLTNFIHYLMERIKGPTVFAASYIVNQMLQSVTKIKIKESRMISPLYIEAHGMSEKCWGGFQFDNQRFDKDNLKFDWFLPQEEEIKFAVDYFNELTSKVLNNIQDLITQYNKLDKNDATTSLLLTDDLRNNFLYLSYALSGISFLFDPSFEEDIPKLNQHENQTIQQRLQLLKQIRSTKDDKSGRDELRIDNLQENLQKIIYDMTDNDLVEYTGDFTKETIDLTRDNNDLNDKEKLSFNIEGKDTDTKAHHSLEYANKHIFDMESSDTISGPDSARASPGVEGIAVSQMNPGIIFRERKIYTSRYYFGDDMETRRSNKLYIKLHRTRYLIGRSLHIISKFLVSDFLDNTKLFKHFLYAVNMWFSDVGRERMLDNSHSKIDYAFVSEVQSINRVRKPYTRIAIGSRLESYHLLRVALHATSRTQTELDKILLEDLVKLSLSTYSAISKPAQVTLVDAMKRLNGSYNVIIKGSIKHLSKALEENDNKRIESGLNLFNIKRIRSKIQNDYYNLSKFMKLLQKCLYVDSQEVNEIAQTLFKVISANVTPPSSVCLIKQSEIDCIRPPDEFIDLEIKAVKLAKEKKRTIYFDKLKKLENSVVNNERSSSHWKLIILNLSLLIDLQLDMEMETSDTCLRVLAKEASSDHPLISRLALKGITKVLNKLYLQQMFDYNLENMYSLDNDPPDFAIENTNPKDKSYYDTWRAEMSNSSNPRYYIDSKANTGWLFWGESMKVVDNTSNFEIKLKESDKVAVQSFCNCIDRKWFLDIVKLWITDNEANSAFQATDVYFTATLILLMSNGYVENFTFEELLSVVEEIYSRDDKSSHIAVCEVLAGILLSSKVLNPNFIEKRDEFFIRFLGNILENDLSPDNSGIWNVFCWWVPAHIDGRRFPKIVDLITNFKLETNSDFAFRDATRLGYIKAFIAAVTWKFPNPEKTLEMCFDFINQQYQAVRDQIGSLLAILNFIHYPDSISSSQDFLEMCNKGEVQGNMGMKFKELVPRVFIQVEEWRTHIENKPPQEALKSDYIYASMTILTWLRQSLFTSATGLYEEYVVDYIVPFLLKLMSMKEVCQLGGIDPLSVLKLTSQILYNGKNLRRVVTMLEDYSKTDLNVVQCLVIGEFTEIIYFKNILKLTKEERYRIMLFTNQLLYHKNVSVRENASSTLSGLIHISPPHEVEAIVKQFSKNFRTNLDKTRKKYRKFGYKKISPEDSVLLHGATLGLGALIHAFVFISPPPKWVPELLATLANKCSGIPGMVGKTAKDSLGKFKKTRQDTWHIDSKVFNESQIQDLEGVLIKSYFA